MTKSFECRRYNSSYIKKVGDNSIFRPCPWRRLAFLPCLTARSFSPWLGELGTSPFVEVLKCRTRDLGFDLSESVKAKI